MKLCLLVPSTTNGLEIDDITQSHLYKILIQSLSKDKPKNIRLQFILVMIMMIKFIVNINKD